MKILTVPHKMLHRPAVPVEVFGPKLRSLIDHMLTAMYKNDGIGLAANQVGVLEQVVVLDMGLGPMVLVNPHIRYSSKGRVWKKEGCLSIPDYVVVVGRSREIFVVNLNRYGEEQNFKATGMLARVVQHEVDHLRGVLINEK